MVLLTKEVFVKLKELINLHVNLHINEQWNSAGECKRSEQWQVYIFGLLDQAQTNHDQFQVYINCESKKEAQKLFKELAKQIIDSGEVPTLNSQLFDEVLIDNKE